MMAVVQLFQNAVQFATQSAGGRALRR
jgi:hypothetical protein